MFLLIVGLLLMFGAFIVFFASSITANDLGLKSLDERLVNARQELGRIAAKDNALVASATQEFRKCGDAYGQFFKKWPVGDAKPGANSFRSVDFPSEAGLPEGSEIAKRIFEEISKPENFDVEPVGLQLMFEACSPRDVFLVLPKDRYPELIAALRAQDFPLNREKANSDWHEHFAMVERARYIQDVINQIYAQKVRADASSGVETQETPSKPEPSNDLLLRLLQTSITRFGVLAIIGFFVSILVSLYRYNIRLAAFYTARADVLRLARDDITVSDFAVLSAALSPNLEFGKTPSSPLAQLTDLLKSVR